MLKRIVQAILPLPVGRDKIVVRPQAPLIVGPADSDRIVIGPAQLKIVEPSLPVRIQPPQRGAWQEKGWTPVHYFGRQIYDGQYQVEDRRTKRRENYPGRIEVSRREIIPYIGDPPAGIKNHPKGPCFTHQGGGWFRVHWHRPPRNIDDAILYIEKVLDEVLN